MRTDNKPHISSTQIEMMSRCGEQWYRRYVKGEKIPPGIKACTGTAVHKTAEFSLTRKKSGLNVNVEEVEDRARDELVIATEERGLFLSSEEWKVGKKKIIEAAKDISIKLSKVHYNILYPEINPLFLEKKILLEMEGYDFDIVGYVDVVEKEGFRDLKTLSKTPSQNQIDSSTQYTIYALWYYVENESFPKITQDSIVETSKNIRVVKSGTNRSKKDFVTLQRKLENFSRIVESGIFHHASPSTAWWCSPNWCGYYRTCKYVT